MSMIRRLHDRLTGVLGRDCKGRPLRVGDRVEPAVPPQDCDELAQAPGEVVGIIPTSSLGPGYLPRIKVRNANGIAHGTAHCWRRLDDDDEASWDRVADATGWKPSVFKRDGVVA